jgi:hypothetical protein
MDKKGVKCMHEGWSRNKGRGAMRTRRADNSGYNLWTREGGDVMVICGQGIGGRKGAEWTREREEGCRVDKGT